MDRSEAIDLGIAWVFFQKERPYSAPSVVGVGVGDGKIHHVDHEFQYVCAALDWIWGCWRSGCFGIGGGREMFCQ